MLRIVNAIEIAGHSGIMVVQAVPASSRQHHRSLARLVTEAMHPCVDTLVSACHKRIALIAAEFWQRPKLNPTCQAPLTRLAHHGQPDSEYHLPAWAESPEGLTALLKAFFFATPPTALLLADPSYCSAASAWLVEHNRLVPKDVSLVSIQHDRVFHLHQPPYATFD